MPALSRVFTTALLAGLLAASALLPPGTAAAGTPSFLVADVSHGVTVHASPGGRAVLRLSGRTPLGSPRILWVLDRRRDGRWGRVVLPTRPNGRTGWIRLRPGQLRRSDVWVIGDLSRRRVTLMRGRRPLASFPAAVGASGSPTPAGRFSVTDLVATGNPGGPFGWFAFGLSGHQPNLPVGWAGGDQLAIHGTNAPWTIGHAASAGCLRVTADALSRLRRAIRLGTPVIIAHTGRAAWREARAASITARKRPAVARARPAADPAPIILVTLEPADTALLRHGPVDSRATTDRQPADRARRSAVPLVIGLLPALSGGGSSDRLAVRCMAGARDGPRIAPPRARARAPT
jgi:L,D-transpeptidase-like protein